MSNTTLSETLDQVVGVLNASGEGKLAYELCQQMQGQLKLLEQAVGGLAQVGFPAVDGKHDRNGKWDFSKVDGACSYDTKCLGDSFDTFNAVVKTLGCFKN